jgi:hypothetical protein
MASTFLNIQDNLMATRSAGHVADEAATRTESSPHLEVRFKDIVR